MPWSPPESPFDFPESKARFTPLAMDHLSALCYVETWDANPIGFFVEPYALMDKLRSLEQTLGQPCLLSDLPRILLPSRIRALAERFRPDWREHSTTLWHLRRSASISHERGFPAPTRARLEMSFHEAPANEKPALGLALEGFQYLEGPMGHPFQIDAIRDFTPLWRQELESMGLPTAPVEDLELLRKFNFRNRTSRDFNQLHDLALSSTSHIREAMALDQLAAIPARSRSRSSAL